MLTTWNKLLEEERKRNNDDRPIVSCTVDYSELEKEFYNEFGGSGYHRKIIAWSFDYVYFEQEYDGALSIKSAPRNPLVKKV